MKIRGKEYCYKAVLNEGYILYIGHVFGGYKVFVTDINHTYNYSIYGAYKNLGTACNRLLKSANSYKTNDVNYFYMTKELLDKLGAFHNESKG